MQRLADPPPTPGQSLTLSLRVNGLAARSATVAVTPSLPTEPYYFSVVPASDYTGDDALIASDLAAFDLEAGQKGLSLSDYLGQKLSTGPDSFTFANRLEPETDYYAYAYGMTVGGEATTGVFRQSFHTPAAQPKPHECTFLIEVSEIAASEATVRFVPSDDATPYFYAVLEKELFDKAQEEGGIFADDMKVIEYMAQLDNQTVEQTIARMTCTGAKTQRYVSLTPETDYYAYAYGLETDGTVTTELDLEPFRTGAAVRQECTFEITVENVTASEATVSVVPSDKELTYLGQYITDEQIETGGDGDLQTYYSNYFRAMADMAGVSVSVVVAQEVVTGDLIGVHLTELTEGETYNVFAVGVDAYGNFITDVALVRFVAKDSETPAGPGTNAPFRLSLEAVSSSSVRLEVTPSDLTARYLAGVVSTDKISAYEGVEAYFRAEIDMYAAMGMLDDYLDAEARTGVWGETFGDLSAGATYHAFAIGVDGNGGFSTKLVEQVFSPDEVVPSALRMRCAPEQPTVHASGRNPHAVFRSPSTAR